MSETKRILADVDPDFFWEVKGKLAELQMLQKHVLPIAIRTFIGSDFPLEKLIDDPAVILRLNEIGIK